MRLLALAQWVIKAGFKVRFIYKECLEALLDKLHAEGFATQKIPSLQELAHCHPSHLVIDDYNLSQQEWALIQQLTCCIIVFDDAIEQKSLPANLIINTSSVADLNSYKQRAPQGAFCLGPKFTLLRKEFITQATHLPKLQQRHSILITMGGTDVLGLSLPLCTYFLRHYPSLPLQVLIGTDKATQLPALQDLATKHPQLQLIINPSNVAEIMAQAGLALSAAGGTLKELACMQVPCIALVCADNQACTLNDDNLWCEVFDFRTYSPNDEEKIAELALFTYSLYENKEKRRQMQRLAKEAIDINGGQHIVDKIMALAQPT